MTEAALGVDTENTSGALRLYERCGFRRVRGGAIYRKPLGSGDARSGDIARQLAALRHVRRLTRREA